MVGFIQGDRSARRNINLYNILIGKGAGIMVDWLVMWGITQAAGLIFKPILEDLAKDAAKDFVKDFFKDSLKKVLLSEKDPRQVACGKAIKEFLFLVQQELKFRKVPDSQIKEYTKSLNKFIHDTMVKKILSKAFNLECDYLDSQSLQTTWNKLQLLHLPPKFNWQAVIDQYLRKTQEIIWESKELRSILDSQNLESIDKNTAEIAGISPEFDLIKYQEGIQEKYGNLKLDSLDTSGYAYNALKLWRIFIPQNVREINEVLPQVHEIPKEHQRRLQENNQLDVQLSQAEWDSYKEAYYRQRPSWVFEIFNDNKTSQYVVILGDPGSGKSTFLQYIALEWAESPIEDLELLPIPLLIELRTYIRNRAAGQCNNFLEFFHKSSGIICHLNQHQLHERLKTGSAVVMFDGLDEIFDIGQREDVITDIHRFTNDYPTVRAIITSRVIGYKPQRLRDAGFRHFMLQDLEQYQIDDFIYRWHELTFNDEAEKIRKRDRLQVAINISPSIRELAGNPLLLTMMAILNRNQELPKDRPELYNQASRVLLYQWDVERALVEDERLDPKTIDYKDKQAMLRQIAYHIQATEKGLTANLIVANDLERILSDYLKTLEISQAKILSKLMINQLRSRNFILCFLGADYYAFVHRTFLEFFCAWEFVWQFKETQILSIDAMKSEVFGKHYQDDAWHEILRLIAGMIEPKFVGDIIGYLIEKTGDDTNFRNLFLATTIISEIRNPSTILELSNRLINEFKLLICNENIDDGIRIQGVLSILNIWQDNSEVLLFLKDLAQSTTSQLVSGEAVTALARIAKESSDALSYLKIIAQSGNEIAIVQLAQVGSGDSNTLKILQTLAHSGNQTAMAEIVRVGSQDSSSLPILKNIVHSTLNQNLKNEAIGALIRYWKQDPELLPILKKLARSGDEAATQGLAQNWKDDPETLSIIRNISISGNYVVVERELGHFSVLRSKITDPECLKSALHSLGIYVKTNADVRGSNGQRVRCNVVSVLEGNYDLGWSINSDGTFDLVVDLWGVSRKHNQTALINGIYQRYAAMMRGYKRFV